MAYPSINDKHFIMDLMQHKEFRSLIYKGESDQYDKVIHSIQSDIQLPEQQYDLQLNSYQLFARDYFSPNTPYQRLLLKWDTGTGKCFGVDTPIMMANGHTKKVQDINIGDQLMGDDSTSRTVLSITRGCDRLYTVSQEYGDDYIVNADHILSLKSIVKTNKTRAEDTYKTVSWIDNNFYIKSANIDINNDIVFENIVNNATLEITVRKYLALSEDIRSYLYGYKTSINSRNKDKADPANITAYMYGANMINSDKHRYDGYEYRNASWETRQHIYNGIQDAVKIHSNKYNINVNYSLDQFIFILRSLGKICHTNCPSHHVCDCTSANIIKIDNTTTGGKYIIYPITVTPIRDTLLDYYGFMIDGNQRFLLGDFTVAHNSIGALAIASEWINLFKKETPDNQPTVFVIGFSEKIFKDELMRYPAFGFINKDELKHLNHLRYLANSGVNVDKYTDFITKIKHRFTNRRGNGLFRFYGYKAFVNRLFNTNDAITPGMTTKDINKLIDAGKIKINQQLFSQFTNSLIIADEIHNVYNTLEKNNWGIAIQYVLDMHPQLSAVFLSATPINNNPTELVDLLNLLLPPTDTITKEELFNLSNKTLKREAPAIIARLCKGKISFLRDINIQQYPSRILKGKSIPGISYLKFIRCEMSPLHYRAYQEYSDNVDNNINNDAIMLVDMVLPTPASNACIYETKRAIYEIHNAPLKWKDANGVDIINSNIIGEIANINRLVKYSSKYSRMLLDIIQMIKTNNNEKGKVFIYHNNVHMSGVLFIQEILRRNGFIGEFSRPNENTICVHCGRKQSEHSIKGGDAAPPSPTAYSKHISVQSLPNKLKIYAVAANEPPEHILTISRLTADKFIIKCYQIKYHNLHPNPDIQNEILQYIKQLNIQIEVSKNNNELRDILKENDIPFVDYKYIYIEGGAATTSSSSDSKQKKKQTKQKQTRCQFKPARFIIVHSDLSKSAFEQSMNKFNAPNNIDGSKFLILIGSRMIKESHNIKAVRHMLIMSRPDNIPTLKQIIGRTIRKKSHRGLPPEKCNVSVYIYTSAIPGLKRLSYEENKYKHKMNSYIIIQRIEQIFHENAVDAVINRKLIYKVSDEFDMLKFNPNVPPLKQVMQQSMNLTTFNAFYSTEEIAEIKRLIKLIFIHITRIATYEDIVFIINNLPPSMQSEYDTTLFDPQTIKLILSQFTHMPIDIIYNRKNIINDIFKTDTITFNGNIHILQQYNNYYILTPLFIFKQHTRDSKYKYQPHMDIEQCYRNIGMIHNKYININSFVHKYPSFHSYNEQRERFIRKWEYVSIGNMNQMLCEYDVSFHIQIIEEVIEYIFNIWTQLKPTISPIHEFYFKLIYFYNSKGIVVWAHTAKQFIADKYIKYIKPVKLDTNYDNADIDIHDINKHIKNADTSIYGIINAFKLTISNISDSPSTLERTGMPYYEYYLNKAKKYIEKDNKKDKIAANLLPVGHFGDSIPKFYDPSAGWYESADYINNNINSVENNIIVGYETKAENSMIIKFKLRHPIQRIKKHTDIRFIERGTLCISKSKPDLCIIAEQLGIDHKFMNITSLCELIRRRLVHLELLELVKQSNVKYYYFHHERMPVL